METVKCGKCTKEFSKPTLAKAEQALRMHAGRIHKKIIVGNGVSHRAAKHKLPGKTVSKLVTEQITINFCPCCGFNLKAVATVIAMAAHI